MNDTTWTIYREYLERTRNESAAASLTLADVLQQQIDAKAVPTTPGGLLAGRPMTPQEFARYLRVTTQKVLGWIHRGELTATNVASRDSGRPRYRITADDAARFQQQRAILRTQPSVLQRGRRRLPPAPRSPLPPIRHSVD